MISAEFIVNTGPYQHVKLTISAPNHLGFVEELDRFSDKMKVALGTFQAETESWVKGTYESLVNGDLEAAQKLLQEAIGATVVEVVDHESKPALSDAEIAYAAANGPGDVAHAAMNMQPAWKQKPETTKPEPWKAPATTNSGDDW